MTFEYTDSAGDTLSVRPVQTSSGPRISFDGRYPVEVPVDHVEELVAGVRDAARQATGQQPAAEQRCAHCGLEVEDRGHPLIQEHSNWYSIWVHVPGGYSVCFPQQGSSSPRATPAVEQPAEAHPPRDRWRTELLDTETGEWESSGIALRVRERAIERLNHARTSPLYADAERRLVRESTTWTIEETP